MNATLALTCALIKVVFTDYISLENTSGSPHGLWTRTKTSSILQNVF